MSRNFRRIFMLATLSIALCATVAVAQIEFAPYVTVHYDVVDPGDSQQYEQNAKDWVKAFADAEAGADWTWVGYQNGFTYGWVSPMPNFAYLDAAEDREKAMVAMLGEESATKLMSGMGLVQRHHTELLKYEPDLSYLPEGFTLDGMHAVNVTVHTVAPGKAKDYRAMVADVVAALGSVDAPVNFLGHSVTFGQGSFAYVTWAESRAALHGGPEMGELLAEAVGPEKAQELYGRFLDTVDEISEQDWRIRGDLSFQGSPAGESE